MNSMRATLTRALQDDESRASYVFSDIVAVLIIISTTILTFESVGVFKNAYPTFFLVAEVVFVFLFAIEYGIRLIYAKNRIRYAFSAFGIIDFLAVAPGILYLATMPVPVDLRVLRVFRVLRVLRLLRSFRMSRLFTLPTKTNSEARRALQGIRIIDIEMYLLVLSGVVVISGSLMYLAEAGVAGATITNIPQGIWWSIVTVTTVGYGDFVPVTVLGKVIASFTMISGLALFAVLIAVMSKSMQTFLFGSLLEEEERLEQKMAEEERKEERRKERREARKKNGTKNGNGSNAHKK